MKELVVIIIFTAIIWTGFVVFILTILLTKPEEKKDEEVTK